MEREPASTVVTDGDRRNELDRAWREHRRHLTDIGFRMLGDLGEAEDVAQEAFVRLARAHLDEIDDVSGWLAVVTSRLCLDRLRARRRHPTTADDSLGDLPAPTATDPADRATLDDHVRRALHQLLGRLTAAERTAFVLHDVFQYPFDAIAEIVGRSPAACRQLASRARRRVGAAAGPERFAVEPATERQVAERFIAACADGDLERLLAVLDPAVEGVAHLGTAGTRVVTGRDDVAAACLYFLGAGLTLYTVPTHTGTGLLGVRDGRVALLADLTVADGRITHFDGTVDPERLDPVSRLLGLA